MLAKYDAFSSHVFDVRAEGVRFYAMEKVRNYGNIVGLIVYIKNIFEVGGGRMYNCIPFILTPGHKLQKPLKECGIF